MKLGIEVLSFFICMFNIVGVLLFVSDFRTSIGFYRELDLKRKIICVLGMVVISLLVVHLGGYLLLFMIAECIVVLIWCKKQGMQYSHVILKGIINILLLLVTELVISILLYYKGSGHMERNLEEMISYIGMAAMQYFLIVFQEMWRIEKGFRKMLLAALEAKAVENMIWLGICICSSWFEQKYMGTAILFISVMFWCYVIFFVVSLKMLERGEMEKRTDIHINTYEYYLHMEEEHLLIRKLYHDMKNQLMLLKDEKDEISEEEQQRIQNLSEKIDTLKQFYHTGFVSLDILLFDGKMKAEAKGIAFEAVISEGCLAFMKEEDVNVIFSNAVINAIEACEKITDGPKSIKIKAGKNLDDTLIYIKNTVSPKRIKGSLHTNKKNKKLHGIGLRSIEECAEKYHGYISIIEDDDSFQLAILFGGNELHA